MKTSIRHKRAVRAIRSLKSQAEIYKITRIGHDWPGFITPEIINKLEQTVKDQFDLWWDTWIEQQLKIIEKG